MQLRLTVIDPTASGPAVDCLVDVGAGARLREIRSDLGRDLLVVRGRPQPVQVALD
jgi:hypothetical protein